VNAPTAQRVLVVDDRADVRLSFMFMLEASGYLVTEAADGAEALAVLARQHVDVVITDIYMPGMDGIAFIRLLRRTYGTKPFIIAMTGSDHLGLDVSIAAAREIGADVILRKPITRPQLIDAINRVGPKGAG
jgi:two-component system chemotaxis response regulator CheY